MTEHDGPIKITKTTTYKSCGQGSNYCKHLDVVPDWVEEPYGERYLTNVWKCKYLDRTISGNETPRWCPYLTGELDRGTL